MPFSEINTQTVVQFEGVTKIYEGGVKALDNVSFSVNKGEFVFIIGPSGAGKSTITKLMIHEETPDNGRVKVADFDIASMHRKHIPTLRRSMGMVFQDFRLLPNKTVYENVAFAMEIIGASQKQIRRRVSTVLSQTGLSDKWKFLPSQLSGGEQQRVGIARALVNNPKFIVADEPTGNLDNDTADGIMELLDQINKCGTTIIMVTHSQQIVERMKKRVITIENGIVVKDEQGGYNHAGESL
ncbi:MAG: cell division ATP-binding protein FtsE [Clostridia bacterium]|nr:cell division ATP-binding protein FtsE [Clostridia bacterium]